MKPALNITLLLVASLSACAGPQRQLDRALERGDWQTSEALLLEHDSLVLGAGARLSLYRATARCEEWLMTLDAVRNDARAAGGAAAALPWYTAEWLSYEQACAFHLAQTERWLSTLVNQNGQVVLTEGEFAFGIQALHTVAGRVPETLLVLGRVLLSNAAVELAREPATWQQLEASTTDAVYRTLYLRRYTTVESLLELLREHEPLQSLWREGYAAWALESRARREGDAALGAADSGTLLQWATRWEQAGLSRAAGAAWRSLAEQRTGNDAAIAWRSAGDALYAAGDTDGAREALVRSVESATDTLLYSQSTARTAHARGDTDWGLEQLAALLDARVCATAAPGSEAVLDAEWQWAAMRLAQQQSGNRATTPSPERVRQVQHRSAVLTRVRSRIAQCNAETLVVQVGQALQGIGQEHEAHELLKAQFDAYGGSYSLFGVWFEQPLTDDEATDIAARLGIWLETLPDEIPDDSLRFLVGALTNRREPAIVEVRNIWLQTRLTSPQVQLPLALVQARYLQEAGLTDERRELLEQVIAAQENPIQARAQVARWMVSRVDAREAAEFAAALAQRPEAAATFDDIHDSDAISIRQYAWRLALTASVESGDAAQALRAAFAWADEQGSADANTWRYLWTLRTVWEILEPEQRIEFAHRSHANGYCPPEMREEWGFALAEQHNLQGAIEVLLPMLHEPDERQDAFIERLVREWGIDAQQRFAAAWRDREGETVPWRRARIMALAQQLETTTSVTDEYQGERLFLVAELRSAVRAATETAENVLPSAEQLGAAYAIVRDLYPASATDERPIRVLLERISENEPWDSLQHDLLAFLQLAERTQCLDLLQELTAASYGTSALPAVRTILYRFRDADGGSVVIRQAERLLTFTRHTTAVESFIEQEILAPAALLQQGVREFGPDWAWRGDTETGAREFLTLAMDYAYHLGHWSMALQCMERLTEFPGARNQSMLELALRMQALHRGGQLTVEDATYWIARWGGDEEAWTMAVRLLFRMRWNELAATVLSLAPERLRVEPLLVAFQMLLPERLQTGNPFEHYATYLEENPDLRDTEIAEYLQTIWRELQFSQYAERMSLLLEISRSRASGARDFVELEGRFQAASGETTRANQVFLPRGATTLSGDLSVLLELGLPSLAMRALDEQAGQLPWLEYLEGAWSLQSDIRPRVGQNAWELYVRIFADRERSAAAQESHQLPIFRLGFHYTNHNHRAAIEILNELPDYRSDYSLAAALLHAHLGNREEVRQWLRNSPAWTATTSDVRVRLQVVQLGGGVDAFPGILSADVSHRDLVFAIWVAIHEGRHDIALTELENSLLPRLLSDTVGWFASAAPLTESGLYLLLNALATNGYAHECLQLLQRWSERMPDNAQLQYEAVRLALEHHQPEADELVARWLDLAHGSAELQAALLELLRQTGHGETPAWVHDDGRLSLRTSHPELRHALWNLAVAQPWLQGESDLLQHMQARPQAPGRNAGVPLLSEPSRALASYQHAPVEALPPRLVRRHTSYPESPASLIQEAIRATSATDMDRYLRETALLSREVADMEVRLLRGIDPETDPDWYETALNVALSTSLHPFQVMLEQLPLEAQRDSDTFIASLDEILPVALHSNVLLLRLLDVLNEAPGIPTWERIRDLLDPSTASEEVRWQVARLAFRSHDRGAAIEWVNRALHEHQDDFAILSEHGPMLLELGEVATLEQLVEQVDAAWPANTLTPIWRGLLGAERHGVSNAHTLLSEGVQELDTFAPHSRNLLRVLVRMGANDHAEALADRLAAFVVPGDTGLQFHGLSEVLAVWTELDPERGLAWYDTRWAPRLGNGELHGLDNALCGLFVAAGQPERAEQLRILSWQLSPDDPVLMNNLAWHWAERGERLNEAEQLARRAVVLENADNPNSIDTLAWIRFQQGAVEEALDMQRHAMRLLAMQRSSAHGGRTDIRAVFLEHYRAMQAALVPADTADPERRRSRNPRRR